MNKMKQLIFVAIGFIIAGLVVGFLLNYTKDDLKNQVSENNERTSSAAVKEHQEKDNTLVFLCLHTEPGESMQLSGYVLNKNGCRFDLKLSEKNRDISQYELIFKDAQESLSEMTGEDYIGSRDIDNLCQLLDMVDASKKFTHKTDEAALRGTTVVYGARYNDDKAELIKIGSFGDNADTPDDSNAKSIIKFLSGKNK